MVLEVTPQAKNVQKVVPKVDPGITYLELYHRNVEKMAKSKKWTEAERHLYGLIAFSTAQTRWFYDPDKDPNTSNKGTTVAFVQSMEKRHEYNEQQGFEFPSGSGVHWPTPVQAYDSGSAGEPCVPGHMCLRGVKVALAASGYTPVDPDLLAQAHAKAKKAAKAAGDKAYKESLAKWKAECAKAKKAKQPEPPCPRREPDPAPAPVDESKIRRSLLMQIDRGYARYAGGPAGLPACGFENMASSLHFNPLLAAPGDVIVYDKITGFSAKLIRPNPPKPPKKGDPAPPPDPQAKASLVLNSGTIPPPSRSAIGHIEIRTYDGMVSDYWHPGNGAKPVSYRVSGIWRKPGHSDLWALCRVKAFLRLLREWAVGANPEGGQYNHLWQTPIHGSKTLPNGTVVFTDMSIHPWAADSRATSGDLQIAAKDCVDSSAGAYGFSLAQWWDAIKEGRCPGNFTNAAQDQMAINLLFLASEGVGIARRDVLSCIREGEKEGFKNGINILMGLTAKRYCPISLRNMPKDWDQTVTQPTIGNISLKDLLVTFQRYVEEEFRRNGR